MKKITFCLLAHFLFLSLCQAQFPSEADKPANGQMGCYAKCQIHPSAKSEEEQLKQITWERQPYCIYTGSDTSVSVKEIIVYDELPIEKIEKRRYQTPCPRNARGESDCEYNVLTLEGGTKVKIKITTDTTQDKPFYLDYYYPISKRQQWLDSTEKKAQDAAEEEEPEQPIQTEWRKVLCDQTVTPILIRSIAVQLEKVVLFKVKDFSTVVFGPELKAALTVYQRNNHLPLENLNFETRNALGVRYE